MIKARTSLIVATGLLTWGNAQAALIDNGDGTVSDTVSGLMWTKDANLAASNNFGLSYNTNLGDHASDSYASSYTESISTNGRMNWGAGLHWIDAMNAANYLGYNDWRLSTVTDLGGDGCNFSYGGTDCGYNVDLDTGELADLWYRALGNLAYYNTQGNPQANWGLNNTGPFVNLLPYRYWTGTQYGPVVDDAWYFITDFGNRYNSDKANIGYMWAVRTADSSNQVPIPGTMLLLGLAGLLVRYRLN